MHVRAQACKFIISRCLDMYARDKCKFHAHHFMHICVDTYVHICKYTRREISISFIMYNSTGTISSQRNVCCKPKTTQMRRPCRNFASMSRSMESYLKPRHLMKMRKRWNCSTKWPRHVVSSVWLRRIMSYTHTMPHVMSYIHTMPHVWHECVTYNHCRHMISSNAIFAAQSFRIFMYIN